MSAPERVLVLDGHTTQALACTRSLGRAGYDVLVASHRRAALATWSRFCRARYRLAGERLEAFAALIAWARERDVRVVLPVTERSCVLCNTQRRAWEAAGIIVGCADHGMLQPAFDKRLTYRHAAAIGIATPPTRVPGSLVECRSAALELGFPCLVKPCFSNAWDGAAFLPDLGAGYVNSLDELEATVLTRRQGDRWPLIQRIVPGRGKGVFALCDHGRPVVWFAHERLRDVRPTGSGSSLRRSIPLDPRLVAPAERLLRELGWHGPVMVEFRDDGAGEPCLIEVNGRFWGSLELAVRAGVDFPRLWLAMLTGKPLEPPPPYRAGVTLRWLWGDMKRLIAVFAGRPHGYPGPYPTRLQGLAEVSGPQPAGTELETWDAGDPWPAFGEWLQGAGELLSRAWALKARRSAPRAAEHPDHAREPVAGKPLRVLAVTSAWPTPGQPRTTHFIKRQVEFLRAAGVQVDVFHFRGRRRPWRYLVAWARLRRWLQHQHYDLIHAQFGQSGLLALPKRLPLVVTFRGSDLLGIIGRTGRHTPSGRLLQSLSRLVARQADAVVVVSEHMKAYLPPSIASHVIPSGLDLELMRPLPRDEARRRLNLPADKPLVLFAANPAVPRKRFALAKQAVELLNRTCPAELVVGWGVPHTEIPAYMSACDVLLFTSMQEGSPNVVKEALACNLPVVSVPIGDVPQRLAGIEGCELCQTEDPRTIAAALHRVLRRGGRINGQDAVRQLDERLLTQQVIGVYRSVLESRSSCRVRGDLPHVAC